MDMNISVKYDNYEKNEYKNAYHFIIKKNSWQNTKKPHSFESRNQALQYYIFFVIKSTAVLAASLVNGAKNL